MCLAIPMRVLSVERGHALCEAEGARRSVSLFLLQHESIRPGTWLAVDRGFALEVLSEQRAAEAWAVMQAMLDGAGGAARLAEPAFLPSRDLIPG
jgi:hydrogenase expression/formation protein HypC